MHPMVETNGGPQPAPLHAPIASGGPRTSAGSRQRWWLSLGSDAYGAARGRPAAAPVPSLVGAALRPAACLSSPSDRRTVRRRRLFCL